MQPRSPLPPNRCRKTPPAPTPCSKPPRTAAPPSPSPPSPTRVHSGPRPRSAAHVSWEELLAATRASQLAGTPSPHAQSPRQQPPRIQPPPTASWLHGKATGKEGVPQQAATPPHARRRHTTAMGPLPPRAGVANRTGPLPPHGAATYRRASEGWPDPSPHHCRCRLQPPAARPQPPCSASTLTWGGPRRRERAWRPQACLRPGRPRRPRPRCRPGPRTRTCPWECGRCEGMGVCVQLDMISRVNVKRMNSRVNVDFRCERRITLPSRRPAKTKDPLVSLSPRPPVTRRSVNLAARARRIGLSYPRLD
jgi:hypothetical protein